MSDRNRSLQIADAGQTLTLHYREALACHRGQSWFGVAAGFRMLQAAGQALSQQRLWDREQLFVVSGHPGNGVRDAVEYVTACVSRGRYRVDGAAGACSPDMRFYWEVDDGVTTAVLRMRDGFVPDELFALLGRLGGADEQPTDRERFAALKRRLAEAVWHEALTDLFRVDLLAAGVAGHA